MSQEALQRAVDLAGGQTPLAEKLSELMDRPIRQAHVWNWLHRDRRIPGEVCIPIERATGGRVTRSELRPDLYPQEHA